MTKINWIQDFKDSLVWVGIIAALMFLPWSVVSVMLLLILGAIALFTVGGLLILWIRDMRRERFTVTRILMAVVGGVVLITAWLFVEPYVNIVLVTILQPLAITVTGVGFLGYLIWNTIRGRYTAKEVLWGSIWIALVAGFITVYIHYGDEDDLDLDCIAANGLSYPCP